MLTAEITKAMIDWETFDDAIYKATHDGVPAYEDTPSRFAYRLLKYLGIEIDC